MQYLYHFVLEILFEIFQYDKHLGTYAPDILKTLRERLPV
jgi:hypothetical protein